MRHPDHRTGAVGLRQHQRHRLVGLPETVGDGDLGLSGTGFVEWVGPHVNDLSMANCQNGLNGVPLKVLILFPECATWLFYSFI